MKNRYTIPAVLLIATALFSASAEGFSVPELMEALRTQNASWQNIQASSRAAHSQYRASRASLYPTVSGEFPLSYGLAEGETTLYTTTGSQTSDSFSVTPTLSLAQLLPTAGVLTASAADSVAMERVKETDFSGISTDPEWSNSISLSAGLSQPLYFGNAYQAAVTVIEKSLESSLASNLDARNQLVIAAVSDFYGLKQSLYSLELIKTRLEKDRENYKRIETEYEMGLWTKSVLYQARSTLLQSETDLLEAEQHLEARMGLFTANFALSESPEISPEVSPLIKPETEPQALLSLVRNSNAEAIQMKNAVRLQQASITSAEKDQAPSLSLGGSWSLSSGLGDNDETGNTLSLSLGVSASLYDGGSYRNTMDKMRADLEGLDAVLESRLIQLENQTQTLLDSIKRADQLSELYSLQEEAARYEYEKGILDFELGQITKKDLSELRLALESVLLGVQQNRINTNIYYLQLLALSGEELSEADILQ